MREELSHRSPAVVTKAEADRLPAIRVAVVGFAALVLFALATWFTQRMYLREIELIAPTGPAPTPEVGKNEIGLVNQKLFELQGRAQQKQIEQQRHLSSYGWVDRGRGLIWIPVEQAMREMASDSKR